MRSDAPAVGNVPHVTATTEDTAPPTPDVSPGDVERWREVAQWKDRSLQSSSGMLSPVLNGLAGVRGEITSFLRRVPGVSQVDDSVQGMMHQLAAAGAGAGAATLRRGSVFAEFRAQGHDVTDFKDIRKLDIAQVEAAMPRLDIGYTVFAGIQGGVTGFLSGAGITA